MATLNHVKGETGFIGKLRVASEGRSKRIKSMQGLAEEIDEYSISTLNNGHCWLSAGPVAELDRGGVHLI